MSLLVLMYHRAGTGPDGNSREMLDAHFAHIAARYRVVTPGESLEPGKLNVCLSFDDGYFDFLETVLPLLIKHRLRALLAIPASVPLERTAEVSPDRLALRGAWDAGHLRRAAFCTWPELKLIARSRKVAFAAHGFTHTRLDGPKVDCGLEIHTPKTLLGSRLNVPVESFVFPFGRFSQRTLTEARLSYPHVFRIGGAINESWSDRLIYRVPADAMSSPSALFAPQRMAVYQAKALWNRVRGR